MRRAFAPLAFAAFLGGCAPSASGDGALPRGEGYDFFVLALAWSPSYCEIEGDEANRQQCADGRNLGFVVHGLWPQFESGWPEYCDHDAPRRVPDALVRENLDIMPSASLMGRQWRKHGTCAGVSQRDYFTLVRAARERVVVPDEYVDPDRDAGVDPDRVEAAFLAANPGMRGDGFAVVCNGRHLAEVRICLAKDMEFRSCPEVDARACRLKRAAMPAPD